jgi:hypothetical protein
LCPHALGTKNGRGQALFLQFGGMVKGHRRCGAAVPLSTRYQWLCVPLEDLTIEAIRPGPWHTEEAEYPARKATCLDSIEAQI